ncbi:MAG: hydrogenase maturation nickel metallochaperone HypA [Candidatus Lokiarchaeota archaeon]|nr:hydrogenase maturation nickel metallochaperone HypA [Candidatus Lokiarchaeota archaeon]
MHEFDFAHDIFRVAEQTAKKYKAKRVTLVILEIGELTLIIPELLEECFDIVSKNSIVENAKLEIKLLPGYIKCKDCQNISKVIITYEAKLTGLQLFRCDKCNSPNTDIIEGKKFNIKSIKIEE